MIDHNFFRILYQNGFFWQKNAKSKSSLKILFILTISRPLNVMMVFFFFKCMDILKIWPHKIFILTFPYLIPRMKISIFIDINHLILQIYQDILENINENFDTKYG